VLDVGGRRVWSRALPGTAGRHRVAWDGRDSGGARVPAGVYFARLTGSSGARRFVRIE
jgi:flagellar hook assembly protein FlgD